MVGRISQSLRQGELRQTRRQGELLEETGESLIEKNESWRRYASNSNTKNFPEQENVTSELKISIEKSKERMVTAKIQK